MAHVGHGHNQRAQPRERVVRAKLPDDVKIAVEGYYLSKQTKFIWFLQSETSEKDASDS